jgi:mannose-1-phosphate guanylyltransferase
MSNHTEHAFAVILAGGSGTRLWPMSRDNKPKQFLKLGGDETLLQQAAKRISQLIEWEKIIVVTNREYVETVQQQLPDINPNNIIAEPMKRDTALAMAIGALVAQKADPEAVVTNIASDHVLKDEAEYLRVINRSLELANSGEHLITVGVTPTGPNVNFGYIKVDNLVSQSGDAENNQVYQVNSFKEKPDLPTAETFLAEGNYFWNANMYTWKVSAILEAFHRYFPEADDKLAQISEAIQTPRFNPVLQDVYEASPKISIDFAISEKADNLLLIPGDFGWDDVGLWSTVYELGEKDGSGTVIVRAAGEQAPVVSLDGHNNLVSPDERLIALIGVEDLVVVDSQDVIMIAPRSRSADIKKMVEKLKTENLDEYL